MRAVLIPYQRVRISGPSMSPTLRDGDTVIVRHGAHIRPGDVVLAVYRAMPDRHVVKRAVRPVSGAWWLASDNAAAGGGSDTHGVADVLGRVLIRYRPERRTLRRVGRVTVPRVE